MAVRSLLFLSRRLSTGAIQRMEHFLVSAPRVGEKKRDNERQTNTGAEDRNVA